MRSNRDIPILKLLFDCGGVATVEQLAWNTYDKGKFSSGFARRLGALVKQGFMQITYLPKDWKIEGCNAQQVYVLTEQGAAQIQEPYIDNSFGKGRDRFFRSEVVRQFNGAGYTLQGGFAEYGVDAFQFYSNVTTVICFWSVDAPKATLALEKVMAWDFDPQETSFVFIITNELCFLKWRNYLESVEFNRLCPYSCKAFYPKLLLNLGSVGDPQPFKGWYTALTRIGVCDGPV
jgi:hypothetical protein